jgi:hypothetical protein
MASARSLVVQGLGLLMCWLTYRGNGIEVVHEHLVIRDLELPPFAGSEDDMAIATGRRLEGWQEGGVGDGRIVGHAEWAFRPRDWVEQWEEEQRRKRMANLPPPPPRDTNAALVEDFEAKVNAMWIYLMKGREHYGE